MNLKGKVALITGGARGIGRAIAEELLQLGAEVCLLDVLKDQLTQTEAELRQKFGEDHVITSVADVTQEEEFKASFEQTLAKFGKVNILINNAGVMKETLWEKMLSINLGGPIRGTLLAMKYMNPENGGVVVNIASEAGIQVTRGPMPVIPAYTASKAAVVAYTKCFALNPEIITKKIRLVSLCPIVTDTDMVNDTTNPCVDWDALFSSLDKTLMMKPSEVGSICRQLIEDDTNSGKVALIEGVNKYSFV